MIILAQTKGGAGKSTTAMQALAPWLHTRFGSATLVELDDQNHDSSDYENSVINTHQLKMGKESMSHLAVDRLLDQYDLESLVLDIGGNRTCEMALDAFGLAGYEQFINLIVIPVTSTGQDVTNARRTLDIIRKKMPAYDGPILLAITRVIDEDPDVVESVMPDAYDFLRKEKLLGPIIIPARNCFAMSRKMKRTVWELGEHYPEIEAELRNEMLASKNNNDITRAKEVGFLNKIVRESQREYTLLNNIFTQLDTMVGTTSMVASNHVKSESADK